MESQLKRLSPTEREAEIREVGQHLEALIGWHLQQGQALDEATRLANEQFGQAEGLGRDLNQVALQKQIWASARRIGQAFAVWCCLWLLEFLVLSSMNDKPTDFPYLLRDRLVLTAVMATPALLSTHFYHKAMKKRKSRTATS